MADGYANATVTAIVRRSRVSRTIFYRHFTSKQHAFLEAEQHPMQEVLDACAKAYYSSHDWPEQIWRCLKTLLGLIVANPAMAHLRLVECYAAGPTAVRRSEETTMAFTFFLEAGCRHGQQRRPRVFSEAIVGAIFEIIQQHVAHEELLALPRALPQLAYIALTPFTGHAQASGRIEQLSSGATNQD